MSLTKQNQEKMTEKKLISNNNKNTSHKRSKDLQNGEKITVKKSIIFQYRQTRNNFWNKMIQKCYRDQERNHLWR